MKAQRMEQERTRRTDRERSRRMEQERARRRKRKRRQKRILRTFVTLCTLLLLAALGLFVVMGKDMKERLARQEVFRNQEEYPERLLELLEKNPETLEFVRAYPEEKDKEHKISIEDLYREGEVPLFIQWDRQWGYDSYGSGMIALDGCGPTCLSMVYVGLTGDLSMHPKAMADFSADSGYVTEEAATSWSLMSEGAGLLGLTASELPLDAGRIRGELEEGHPIICSMRPGDFTTTGHFIVLTGIDENGEILVHDPNSRIRSGETWDLDQLMSQMKNLWSYTV